MWCPHTVSILNFIFFFWSFSHSKKWGFMFYIDYNISYLFIPHACLAFLKYAPSTLSSPFGLSWLGGWDILQKRKGNRKRGSWFWDMELRFLCKVVLVVEENFMQSLSVSLLFLDNKKRNSLRKLSWSEISSL